MKVQGIDEVEAIDKHRNIMDEYCNKDIVVQMEAMYEVEEEVRGGESRWIRF